jgi:cytochrome P450
MYKQSWIDRPDVFDPDRWADTAPQAAKLREMLMPFSVGKRNCIGQTLAMMELRVLAGNLLRYYDFELVGPEPNIDLFVTLKLDELDVKVKTR